MNLTRRGGTPSDVCKWPVTNDLVIPGALLASAQCLLRYCATPVRASSLSPRGGLEFSAVVRYILVHPSRPVRSSVSRSAREQTEERVTGSGWLFVSSA